MSFAFHAVGKISNLNVWTEINLAIASCSELTLFTWIKDEQSNLVATAEQLWLIFS